MSIAPADAIPRKLWPLWRKIVAYLVLTAVASASIWFVDREAMQATYFWDLPTTSAK